MSAYEFVAGEEVTSSKLNITGLAHVTDIGAANAYEANPQVTDGTGTYDAFTSYEDGVAFSLIPLNTNTGASTFNVNGIGALSIVLPNGDPVRIGDIRAGVPIILVYNGTNFTIFGASQRNLVEYLLASEDLTAYGAALGSSGELERLKMTASSFASQASASMSGNNTNQFSTYPIRSGKPYKSGNDYKQIIILGHLNSGASGDQYMAIYNKTLASIAVSALSGVKVTANCVDNCFLTPTSCIQGACDNTNIQFRRVTALDTSPSAGSAFTYAASAHNLVLLARYSDTMAIAVVGDNSNNLSVVALTDSSGTISAGTPLSLGTFTQKSNAKLRRVRDTNKYVLQVLTASGTISLRVITFDGATLTAGTPVTISIPTSANDQHIDFDFLDDDRFFVAYQGVSANTTIEGLIATISGTTITLASSSNIVTGTTGDSRPMVQVAAFKRQAIVSWDNSKSNGFTRVFRGQLFNVSGNTITAVGSPQSDFGSSGNPTSRSMTKAFDDSVLIFDRDGTGASDVTAFVLKATNNKSTFLKGIFKNSYSAAQLVELFVRGTVYGLSGLTVNGLYSIALGGELVEEALSPDLIVGRALSATSLQIRET